MNARRCPIKAGVFSWGDRLTANSGRLGAAGGLAGQRPARTDAGFAGEGWFSCGYNPLTRATSMPTYDVPKNAGKFIVVVARGGHFAVWNRKNGDAEVSIPVRTIGQAREICKKLNQKDRPTQIGVF